MMFGATNMKCSWSKKRPRADSSAEERWRVVSSTPDGREFDRLVTKSNQHSDRMAGLIEQMWTTNEYASIFNHLST
jgi:hypothetical protein